MVTGGFFFLALEISKRALASALLYTSKVQLATLIASIWALRLWPMPDFSWIRVQRVLKSVLTSWRTSEALVQI